MEARIRFLALGLVSCLLLIVSLGFRQHVQAAENEQTFVIHKRVYQNKNELPIIKSSEKLEEDSPLLKDSTGINGAIFTVYDVTKEYWQLATEGKTNEEILTLLQETAQEIMNESNKRAEKTTSDDPTFGAGIATFSLAEKVILDGQEKYAVYLFHQRFSPLSEDTTKLTAVVVGLPNESSGDEQSIIHLYPKSRLNEHIKLNKKLNEEKQNFAYGERINYVIDSTIPENIFYLASYKMTDIYDAPLDYVSDSIQIYLDGVNLTSLFTFTVDETTNKMTLEITGDKLRENNINAGASVKVEYQMVLNGQSEPDIYYKNVVRLTTLFNQFRVLNAIELPELVAEALPVTTAGKNFIKSDMDDQKKGLENAVFLVKNMKGEYLVRDKDIYSWQKNKTGSYEVTSDQEGHFVVKGLGYGTYLLEEIKAPVGYKLLDKDVSFKMEEGAYQLGNQKVSPLKIMNAKVTTTSSDDSKTSVKPKRTDFPKMGEIVSTSLVIIGMCIIIGASVYLIRRRKK
ncbi:SpaH/EbpB family LPXTG-anchored major pilin [Enterococcus ureasiticus]|uniref:Uncharacterized protein n=1 Tax=Enterococcus ureasiticus TaxID=903984 RepID=A0A1E5GF34_9ENTE|nr:SpaH/EbpB family LPXTG-anchored major pilin [Enterococcus ureasiticus]OEG11277.1 hypothetical protein BCR21_08205 [Enterococcus ureasiticus]